MHYVYYFSKFTFRKNLLYTFVNRDSEASTGPQIQVPLLDRYSYYDIYHGVKFQSGMNLSFTIEANGYGAVYITNNVTNDLLEFLSMMNQMTKTPLSAYSADPKILQQTIVVIPPTQPTRYNSQFPANFECYPTWNDSNPWRKVSICCQWN